MAYLSPHHAHEFLKGATLATVHDYILRCQRRPEAQKKDLIEATREIDLCARIAGYFGPSGHLAAQGTTDIDIQITGPTIRAEVKFFKPPAVQWIAPKIRKDWDWLLNVANNGEEFRKRAWLVFWPSAAAKMYKLTNCLSVSRTHGTQFSLTDFAPFAPYAEPELPPNGVNQRLRFKKPDQLSVLQMPGGKRVRVDIVGNYTDPLWCAIYTRTVAGASPEETACTPIQINDIPIVI